MYLRHLVTPKGLGSGALFENNTLEEVSYDNGKMETWERASSVETIQGARGDGTAL